MIVEKKIKDPIEFTPQMAFWNGEYLYSQVEIETRMFGAEDIGPQTGGNLNVVIRTMEKDAINEICFPKAARELMKGRKGLSFLDAGILADGENLFFTEFAGCRWGWGGVFSEMSAAEDGKLMCTNYFEAVSRGEDPYRYEVGASVALYNIKPDPEVAKMPKDGMQIIMKDGYEDNLFITQLRKEKEGYVNVGYRWYDDGPMGYAVGRGDTIEEAAESAYEIIQGISMKGLINRPKSDFLNPDYPSAIMKRYQFLVDQKLITSL
jgi:phosphoribosylamine-glycine ligase